MTDEESRIMPSSDKGFVQAYNGQTSVDGETMLIVESHISQAPNDEQELVPALASLAALPDKLGKVDTILADACYFNSDKLTACKKSEIEPFIPLNSGKAQPAARGEIYYPPNHAARRRAERQDEI